MIIFLIFYHSLFLCVSKLELYLIEFYSTILEVVNLFAGVFGVIKDGELWYLSCAFLLFNCLMTFFFGSDFDRIFFLSMKDDCTLENCINLNQRSCVYLDDSFLLV